MSETLLKSPPQSIFCWSGGKDSAFCLHKVLSEKSFEVKYLLCTLNENFRRVSMHGVREELLDAQAAATGIPLLKVWVKEGSNAEYEQQMEKVLKQARSEGIVHVIFGDIFLEDLRAYREQNLARVNMQAVFPLWNMNTSELLNRFIALGFKTVLCCSNANILGEEWVGREIDESFIQELPAQVDPCGENGEYHSFCYDGPLFKQPVRFKKGEKVYRPVEINSDDKAGESHKPGFWFCDLLPAEQAKEPLIKKS